MFAPRVLARSTPRLGLARAPLRRRPYSSESPKLYGAEDNEFNRERARMNEHAAESGEFWRKLCLYVALPCLGLGAINAKLRWDAHWEHQAHEEHVNPRAERPEYPYQNIRTKNFWWGDGDKTAFWNDKTNFHKKDE
ncbi:cytochrome c oxidase-like protein subunit VIa [Melanomma pulvis-pyrius CBS 109.77]|uniref:Cytochrome c oxidase subunit n=1 Tax=Melanomma pulvis-pyrius CBS 109.77 TaxID=1314802 RepID=A0A6A6XBT2_9PLEO|nr:cytochrome c oxidase-like protein subunit VIa [Melanomma pulvis-pyrius CBS 109.77]